MNSKYFRSIVKGKKKRLSLRKIRAKDRSWIKEDNAIVEELVSFFRNNLQKKHLLLTLPFLTVFLKLLMTMKTTNS